MWGWGLVMTEARLENMELIPVNSLVGDDGFIVAIFAAPGRQVNPGNAKSN